MTEKDFLSQFSGGKKPDSFKEEERKPVKKEKKKINIWFIIIPLILIVGVILYFVLFAGRIEMPQFVGENKTDVGAWVKQYGVDSTGILFKSEYSFEYNEGIVVSQSVEAGSKIKKNAKITFVLSDGADPNELVKVPDLESMDKESIQAWIKENKLSKTKIVTAFSDTVAEGDVISIEFKGCDEDSFTRSSTLNIQISKGPQPVGKITVENFVNKPYSTVEAWAKNKKIELVKTEKFSDEVYADMVISQSVAEGKTMEEGETLSVVVSLGKGLLIPNLVTMSSKEVDAWIQEHGMNVSVTEKYTNNANYVIYQSVNPNTTIASDKKVDIVLNLGSSFYMSDVGLNTISAYDRFIDKLIELKELGIEAYAGQWSSDGVYSYEASKGTILSIKAYGYDDGKEYQLDGKLPLDVRFDVVVSKGKICVINNTGDLSDGSKFITAKLSDVLTSNNIAYVVSSSEDTCSLYVDGVEVPTSLSSFEIREDQTVELK